MHPDYVPIDALLFVHDHDVAKKMLEICYRLRRMTGQDPYTRELLRLARVHCNKGEGILKKLAELGLIRRYPGKKCLRGKDGKEYCIDVVYNEITPLGIKVLKLLDGVDYDNEQG